MSNVKVEEIAFMLDHVGSDHDPVWYRGVETTPRDLSYSEHARKDASHFRISFYGGRGQSFRRRTGTLIDMLIDRIGYRPKRRKGKA